MTRLVWNSPEQRRYESGVDRGVLYLDDSGVPWNGLTSVEETSVGGEVEAFYFDGIKYLEKTKPKHFQATITAFSAPKEFAPCVGELPVIPGFILTRQPRKRFGFSYRTLLDNGDDYKIHIIYNATASLSSRGYSTLTESPEPTSLSWTVDAVPPKVSGHRPSAHFTLDTTKTDLFTLRAIEDILYGTATSAPRLPSVEELVDIVGLWEPKLVVPSTDPITNLLSTDPEAAWSLNDLSGLTSEDLSGNLRTASYVGGVLLGEDEGPYGQPAPLLDGEDDHILTPAGYLQGASAVSFEIWFKVTSDTRSHVIVGASSEPPEAVNPGGYVPQLAVLSDGRIRSEIWTGQEVDHFLVDGPYNNNEWHHAILTAQSNVAPAETLILDGVLVASRNEIDVVDLSWCSYLYFGVGFDGGSRGVGSGWIYAKGSVALPSVHLRAIPLAEAQQRYQTVKNFGISALTPGLGDLTPSKTPGLYRDLPTTRLAETAVGGLYRLE